MNKSEDIYRILGASNHSKTDRVEDDFYSTPTEGVERMLDYLPNLKIELPNLVIEPSVGTGSIANPIIQRGHQIAAFDIVDRGFPNTIVLDWLKVNERPEEPIAIVANFPFNDILAHTKKSLSLLRNGEYLIELAKIQFLEGLKRRELFDKQPPKYVLVFSKRIKCLANGKDTGSSSAVCFCWYLFEKGYKGMPMVGWL